jgi:DNA-binding IclR family transcriptional regulator
MQGLAEHVDQNVLLLERVDDHTVVIDAARPKRRSQTAVSIGQQFPLLAPIGGAIVAWDPDRVERWVHGASDDSAARYRESLEHVRTRGFEVRIDVAAPLLEELRMRFTALRTVDAGDLVEEFATRLVGEQDELDDIDDDTTYPVSGISAPVFDTLGAPPRFAMAITFRSGSNQLCGRDIWQISEQLLAATQSLTRTLGVT